MTLTKLDENTVKEERIEEIIYDRISLESEKEEITREIERLQKRINDLNLILNVLK